MYTFYSQIISTFSESLEKFSTRHSFCINDTFYTYEEFGRKVSAIRTAISDRLFKNNKVGLVINDDIETYASIFALWLEGDCYVPLHPNWPLERCQDICDQIGMDLILDSSNTTRYDRNIVLLTSELSYENDNLVPKMGVSDEELAYILFTSGSTGKPKGVQLSRKNLAAFVNSFFFTYPINEEDRCLQCFDLSFDLSIISFLTPIIKGACVYTVPSNGVKYVQVGNLIETQRLTFALMAPSTIKYLMPYFGEIDCSSLKYSLFCGEALPLDVTDAWSKCADNAIIDNAYGPTEDTIWCSLYRYKRNEMNKTYNGVISIGKPTNGCRMEIFSENLGICANEELGELCLAGEQLSPGYINNPEKNNESFFEFNNIRWYILDAIHMP